MRLLITAAVDEAPHSLLDLVDFCYQAHLMGREKIEGWVETAIKAIPRETGLLASVVASGVNAGLADQEFVDFATSIELDAKTLIKSDVVLIGSIAINMVAGMMENFKAMPATAAAPAAAACPRPGTPPTPWPRPCSTEPRLLRALAFVRRTVPRSRPSPQR